ncbi:MAG: hypothetical protein KDI63_17115 [Gammaproteobacteria bacterium]|nr:hypothetical protein [Gammaproteobacteria bacterium]MCB1859995.1 hypothetical protein [Gammaproteobacteria bacterium]
MNDLIRKAQEIGTIPARLIAAEQSGFIKRSRSEILADIMDEAQRSGER